MISCLDCACDLFVIVQDGTCWLACWNCHAIKRNDPIPIGVTYRDPSRSSPLTSLELFRLTNADGLDNRVRHRT